MRNLLLRFVQAKSGVVAIAQTVVANVAIQGANVAAGVMTARALGPAGRGALAAIVMWPQFLAYALTLGVPVATVYSIKRTPSDGSSLTGAALALSSGLGLLASCVGLMTIPHSLHSYPPAMIHFAQMAVLLAPLSLCGITLSVQVQAAGSFKHYNLFRFLPPVSVLLVLIVERFTGTLTPYNAALAYLLAGVPVLLWNLAWVWKHFQPSFRRLLRPTKVLLGYGLRAWGADLLGMIANQVDRILVVGMLRPEAMGLYVVAQSAAGILNAIPNAVVPVSMSKASGRSMEEIVGMTGETVRITLLTMLIASVPLFSAGAFLLKMVYGAKFIAAATVLPFLIIETILDGITAVLSQAFLAAGYPGTITFLQGCGVASAIPLLYWLIPLWGVKGAGCALMVATAIRFLFILVNFPYRLKMRPPRLLPGRDDVAALIAKGLARAS